MVWVVPGGPLSHQMSSANWDQPLGGTPVVEKIFGSVKFGPDSHVGSWLIGGAESIP